MSKLFGRAAVPVVLAVLAVPAWSGLSAQQQGPEGAQSITVTGSAPADLNGLTDGPDLEGVI